MPPVIAFERIGWRHQFGHVYKARQPVAARLKQALGLKHKCDMQPKDFFPSYQIKVFPTVDWEKLPCKGVFQGIRFRLILHSAIHPP